ncbi:amino acid ABC transporter permease [Sodalis sp. RH21]|uniref:amino acid ABC transporter permease n=1 Tax=unclassified Sodalis (in: enterobacteria) TaxID=2636512 RepID=UPI0039B500A8
MDFNFFVIQKTWHILAEGAVTTFWVCCLSLAFGIILGAILCWGKMQRRGPLYRVSVIMIELFRTIPELIPIFWIYTCIPLVFDVRLSAMSSGVLALTLFSGSFLAEIFRTGILAIPQGQYEACTALSIPLITKWKSVIIPQATKVVFPAFINFTSDLVKISSLLSTIGIADLAYQAAVVSGENYRYLEVYTLAAFFYLLMIVPLSLYGRFRENRTKKNMAR